jgi:hypothetical protein
MSRVASNPARTGTARALIATSPPPRRRYEVLPLTLTKDGRLPHEAQLDRLEKAATVATDCFVFCHGWLYDEAEARRDAGRFFALLEQTLAPLRERVAPLRVVLHWPSRPFAGGESGDHATGPGVWPEIEQRVGRRAGRRAGRDTAELMRLLRDLVQAEVPAGPEEEAELDLLGHWLATPPGARGALPISPSHALSFWTMKRRAGAVGERVGREHLAPLWRSLGRRAPRLHLVGHSFGAKLVTSAVLGGLQPESVTLLLAAFSAFAFAAEVPGYDRPGFYHRVLDERLVDGPIAVLRSEHDAALRAFYPALTGSGEVDRHGGRRAGVRGARAATAPGHGGAPRGRAGVIAYTVAASALGAVGARGVSAPEVDLVDVQQIGLPRVAIVNVDGSRVVRARDPLVGAHRDIYHREVATLVLLAAGLLVGGPAGARPRPLDPLHIR